MTDEYKKIREETKEELKTDPEILDEIKEEIKADFKEELLSEQQHLLTEIENNKQEIIGLQGKKETLQIEINQEQENIKVENEKFKKEQAKVKAEQKNFKDIQLQFKPRKEDLDKINKISQEAKPTMLRNKISVSKEDWDFIINIAKQHAKISDTTLTALESHDIKTKILKRCQSLYLAVATEVAALGYSDISKLTHRVQDVLRDIEDTRVVSWLIDDMINHKPSDLEEMLELRQDKINKKYSFAKKVQNYNQTDILQKIKDNKEVADTKQKANKKSYDHER